jgi:uncharacterized membrane protein YphA (DoxX/SURF4 family)
LALAPGTLYAHVKWFVPLAPGVPGEIAPFSVADPAVQVWLVVALVLVGASLWLDRKLPALAQPQGHWRTVFNRSLPVLTGLSLLLSAEAGSIIAPHYQWQDNYALGLLALEVLTGLLLLFPPTTFAGALSLLLLYAGLMFRSGPLEALEYFNIAGAGGFLLCVFHPVALVRQRLEPYALPLLRIATGIALITLGFAEKLLRPDYAEDFLQTYMWNFMHNAGLENFSDRLFVLSAGTMEVVFGAILVLGTTTRLNIIAISGFMLTSNTTFFVTGNMREAVTEIIGHLPIMATAIVCVAYGSGAKLRPGRFLRWSSLTTQNHSNA